MASASWKTAQSGDWSAAADWSTNTVPTAADDVTIAVGGSYTVTVSVPEAAKTLSLTDSGAVLQVSAGLSVGGGFTAAGGTVAVSSGQTLSLAGAVTFGVNGTTGPTVNGPGTVLTSGATSIAAQTGGNYPDLFIGNGATWVNTGTVTDAGLIYFGTKSNDSVTLTNGAGGVFNLTSSNAGFNTQYSNVGATFNNAGLLEKTAGTGNSNFIAALNNTGTVSVTAGTLTLANGGTLGGAVGSSGAGLLAFSGGSFNDTGTLSGALLVNGGSLTIAAASTLAGGLTVSSGLLTVAASSSEADAFTAAGGTIAVSSGQTLSLAGAVTFGVNGTTGPTVNGPGTVLTSGATSITAQTGGNYPDLFIGNGATWVNTGTVTDAGLIYFGTTSNDTVTLTNRAGGVFNLTSSNATFNTQYSNVGATFNNAGLLEKTAGTGNSNFIAALNNTGTVSVTAGTLTLANGGTLGGAVGSSGAGLLAFSGGSFNDTGTLSGALLVNGGSLTIAAASTLAGGLTVSSGLLTVAASSSEADAFTAAGGTIAVSSGQTLSLAGAVTFGVNGTTGPTVNGPGTVLTSGATSIAAQTGGNYPDLFIGNGATWVNTGTVTDAGLIYFGTKSNDSVTLTNGAGGVFNLTSSNAGFNTQYSNVGATFNNAGLLEKTAGTGNSNFIAALNNTGTVSVTAGTLTLANGGTLGGAVGSSGAGLLAFSGGSFNDTGTLSGALLVNGGSLTIAAASTLAGGLTVSSGLLTVAASSSEADAFTAAGGTIAVSSGQTLSLAGAVTFGVNGTTGPTVNGPGTVLTSGATSITAQTGGNYPDLFIGNGATWVNTGTVTDAGLIYFGTTSNDTVTLTNRAGGVFNLTSSNATFNTQYSNVGATFNNAGLLEKTAGTGNSNFIAALNNTGTVKVDQASTLTLTNSFTDAGSIVLAGGVLAAPTLTLAAGGTLSGFGTLSAAVVDSGLIDAAGGDLVLTKAPTGTGIERIEAASTLELTAASAGAATFNGLGARLRIDVANSYTGTLTNVAAGDGLILQGVTATGATTSGTALTVNLAGGGTEKFTLSAPLTAIREGVTLDGSGNSSVVFYRYAAPAAVTPVAFANHHVGDVATMAVPVTNTAAADGYSEVLDATVGSANAAIMVAGSVSLLGAGQTSANGLSVTLLTTTGGAKTGTATVGFSTDGAGVDGDPALALAGQTLNVSGNVYNYATASLGAVSYGNHHVGDVVSQAVTLSNTAPAGAFSENLNAAFTGAAGSLTDSGTVFELAAGAASTGLGVTLASGTAGAITGTATLALVSDGSTIDGLGTTALASQVITGSAKIYNYATASLAPSTVSFGNHHVGDAVTQAVTLANNAAAGAYSENLNAAFTAAMGGLTDSGTVSGLAAGSSSAALLVTLATGVAGAISGTATLGLQSDGSTIDGLGTTALASQVIAGSANVYNYATASLAATTVSFGNHHVGDAVTQAVALANNAAAGAYSENLNAAFTAAAGGLTDSGTVSELAAGSSSAALHVTLATGMAGAISGSATLGLQSDGGTIDGLGTTALASQVIAGSANVYNYATASLAATTVSFGNHHVGDAVTQAVTLANNAAAGAYSENLNAAFTAAMGGLTDSGTVSGLAAGSSSAALLVTLATGVAGAISGTATLGLQSDGSTIHGLGTTALAGQTITGSGGIYNYATASVGTTLDLGIAHVGDTVAGAVSVGNAAASGGYSENLDAAFGAAAGLTASGTISALAAGGTSTALSVALTGTVSGKASGTAGLKFASDGAGVDGLGATQLAAATVTASAIFDNYATAALAGTGAGAFGGAGTVFTLDFGTVTQGMNPVSELIQLLNTASGTADRLDGSFTVTGDPSFGNGGFGPVTGESAGASVDAGTISLSRTALGQFSETVTLTAFGVNAAGYHGALAAEVLTVTGDVVACFVTGTLIRTPGGDRPVETMAIGDMVELADGGRAPVRWIGRRSYAGRFLAGQPAAVPVRIRAGALGPLLPERDLLVSPKHAMLVDGVLVAAELLVDGETVVRERGLSRVDYHHLELDRHAIILAEGAATESFVDDDSRNMFHNAHEYRELYGEHSVAATYCAPRVESGLELEAIRRRLASHRDRVGRARAA